MPDTTTELDQVRVLEMAKKLLQVLREHRPAAPSAMTRLEDINALAIALAPAMNVATPQELEQVNHFLFNCLEAAKAEFLGQNPAPDPNSHRAQ